MVTALETGSGVSTMPQDLALTTGTRIKLIPIKPAPPPLILGVASVPSRLSPAAEQFLRVARSVAAEA